MKFGPQRGHFLYIFERFFADFGLLIAALVVCFLLKDFSLLRDHIFVAVIVLLAPVKRLVEYLFTYYSIDNEKLLVESGLINKRKLEIPLANITTVDFAQPLIFQWAKVYSLNVDNAGNISAGDAIKVHFTLKIEEAVTVKALLLAENRKAEDQRRDFENSISETAEGKTVRATAGDILLMGLLKAQGIVILQIFAPLAVIISVAGRLIFGKTIDGQQFMIDFFLHITGPILIIGIIVLLYAAGICFSVAMSFIKYYGFRITDRDNSLFIEYGLFTKKTYTLMKEKISGVNFSQSMLMRLAKKGTLEVFAIGYGGSQEGEAVEIAILYPLMSAETLHEFMERFIPDIVTGQQFLKAEPKAVPYFFLCFRFWGSAAVLAAAVLLYRGVLVQVPELVATATMAAAILLFVLAVTSVIMEYKNTGIYGTEKTIGITCGGFSKTTVFMRTEKVESIQERASLPKKTRKHLTTITLGLLAPAAVSHQRVRNISISAFYEIREKLIY